MSSLKMGLKRGAPAESQLEVWQHLVIASRMFRRIACWSLLVGGIGMSVGAYCLLVALQEPLVFLVPEDGNTIPVGRRSAQLGHKDVEIRYVAKKFLRATMAFQSESVEVDLATAFNLMTDDLRANMESQFAEYVQTKGMSFVEWVKSQEIGSDLTVTELSISPLKGGAFLVRMTGTVRTFALGRERETETKRELLAHLTLVPVERTEKTPHGLLVATSRTRFVENGQAEKKLESKVRSANGRSQ